MYTTWGHLQTFWMQLVVNGEEGNSYGNQEYEPFK